MITRNIIISFAIVVAVLPPVQAQQMANDDGSVLELFHPDGNLIIDRSGMPPEEEALILDKYATCLRAGFDWADANSDKKLVGDETWDFLDEQAFCAKSAQSHVKQAKLRQQQAKLRQQIAASQAKRVELQARLEAAQAEIRAITQGLMAGALAEQ